VHAAGAGAESQWRLNCDCLVEGHMLQRTG
jgi:hypothetical protein